MGDLRDLMDTLIGRQKINAVQLIKSKNLSTAESEILLLQATVQGLEDALAQVALKVEQLEAAAKNDPSIVNGESISTQEH